MKAELILTALDQIREIIKEGTDNNGELPVDPVRMEIILEFCRTEIQKMLPENHVD